MIELTLETPDTAPRDVVIDSPRTTIGRSPRADLTIDDRFASRLHAELRHDGNSYRITDLDSANGTQVNGVSIQGSRQIFHNDEILIGDTAFRIRTIGSVEPSGTRPIDPVVDQAQSRKAPTVETVLDNFGLAVAAAGARPVERGDLLPIISRVGIALLSPASLDEVLQEILELVFDLVPGDRAYVVLRRQGDGDPVVRAASYRDRRWASDLAEVPLTGAIQKQVLDHGQSISTSDVLGDERFEGSDSVHASGIQSVMAVPLSVAGPVFGLIQVDSVSTPIKFDDNDLGLLTAIASVAAIKVENTILLEQRMKAERLRQQVESARNIQLRLFPDRAPTIENYEMTGISLPCEEVGGDYFDFVRISEGELLIALGDVSGKGLDAALLMSSIHATIRAQVESGVSLVELTRRVNRYLCYSSPHNKFATLFCATLAADEHRFHYVNCGHNPPVLARVDQRTELLETTGMPVGILPDAELAHAEVALEPGDVVLIYSDGLNEAENSAGEQFGADRIADVVQRNRDLPTARIRDRIDEALLEFTGDQVPIDDLTLVLVKRIG